MSRAVHIKPVETKSKSHLFFAPPARAEPSPERAKRFPARGALLLDRPKVLSSRAKVFLAQDEWPLMRAKAPRDWTEAPATRELPSLEREMSRDGWAVACPARRNP